MAEEKLMNRWVVVLGAIAIQFCLGAIYAWSVFTKLLTDPAGVYKFTASQSQLIFSVGLATFAVVMALIGGRLQAKIGPRPVAALGGTVLGIGYILGGFLGSSFVAQLVCIGLIGGAGIGLGYVVPIAVGVKWFPDKKGLITGLGVAGFGFGATLWVKLAGGFKTVLWLVPMAFPGLLKATDGFMGLPGVQAVFLIYGVVFLVLVVLGSTVMINPPAGYKPAGWNPPAASVAASGAVDMGSAQMAGTPQFWLIWLTFLAGAMAGLMTIGVIALFGVDALQASGAAADATAAGATAASAMALLAIFNGLGRIAWGSISDKIGRKNAIMIMCLFQSIMMFVFFKLGGSNMGLIVGACAIGFNFGGNFALFPAITADYFGNKNLGLNYGWVFLSYGVGGIAGPYIAGYFKDAAVAVVKAGGDASAAVNAWSYPFMIAGVACVVGLILAAILKPPRAKV